VLLDGLVIGRVFEGRNVDHHLDQREGLQRAFVVQDQYGLLDDVDVAHLAVAQSCSHPLVTARHPRALVDVGFVLVAEAAHQAPAHARDLLGVESEPLIFDHLDADGLEIEQERGAALDAAAGGQPPEHPSAFPEADLVHLDAQLQDFGQLLDQVAKIDAPIGAEVKRDLAAVRRELGHQELHVELELARHGDGDLERLFLLFGLVGVLLQVAAVGRAYDRLQGALGDHLPKALAFGDAESLASLGLDHNVGSTG